jgi:hypothetical protein
LEEFAATADVLILSVEDTRDLAKRITASDTVEEAQPLATEMDAIRIQNEIDFLLEDAEKFDLVTGVEVFAVAP